MSVHYQMIFSSHRISFKWNESSANSTTTYYKILSSNCGSCPTTTTNTTVTCTDVPSDGGMCTFAVQTVFCGNIIGSSSETYHVVLKVRNLNTSSVGLRISTGLLAGILAVIIPMFVFMFTMVIIRKKCTKELTARTTCQHEEVDLTSQQLPSVTRNAAYGQVSLNQPASAALYTKKNVSYNQVTPQQSTGNNIDA